MTSFAVMMGVFFLLLFNYVFGGVIGAGSGVDYTQFLVPGVMVITALTGSLMTGTGIAVDLAEGVDRRFRSLPMSRVAVVAGRTTSDALRNAVSVLFVVALGYVLGFRFASLGAAVVSMLLVVGLGYSFSWISASIGVKLRDPETVNMASMFWLFPLMFASTVFTPADAMPGWLQAFAENQPLSVVSDAVRAISIGESAGTDILLSVLWIAGLLLVFVPLSTSLYNKAA
jgi:ABC-2 type transport system permease protein/oleandomycin transport system permease protein